MRISDWIQTCALPISLIIGRAFDLGETEAAPTISLTDYSRRETDEFGITTVVERSWAKRLSVRVKIETAAIDEVQRRIAALRATPALWIGQAEPGIPTAHGFFPDFSPIGRAACGERG